MCVWKSEGIMSPFNKGEIGKTGYSWSYLVARMNGKCAPEQTRDICHSLHLTAKHAWAVKSFIVKYLVWKHKEYLRNATQPTLSSPPTGDERLRKKKLRIDNQTRSFVIYSLCQLFLQYFHSRSRCLTIRLSICLEEISTEVRAVLESKWKLFCGWWKRKKVPSSLYSDNWGGREDENWFVDWFGYNLTILV